MSKPQSRIGFRLPESPQRFALETLKAWVADLSQLGAGWVILNHDPAQPLPRDLLYELAQAELETVVQIQSLVTGLNRADFNSLAYSLAECGVQHVIAYDRPNNRESWPAGTWDQNQLVERFLDETLPLLQPGGDYWDTAFLRGYLKGITRRTGSDLVGSLALSAYAWSKGKSLDWGAGGPVVWPAARPYFTPENSQDHIGVNVADWYATIAEDCVGIRPPVIVVGGGARVNEEGHAVTNGPIAQALSNSTQFTGVAAFCFESVPPSSLRDTWFGTSSDSNLMIASSKGMGGDKAFEHYLLLPAQEDLAVRAWRQATAFVLTHQPTVGFDTKEARGAAQVTLAGDELAIPPGVEEELLANGCKVQRMSFLPPSKSACTHPSLSESGTTQGESA
jgi:hypothetical protein